MRQYPSRTLGRGAAVPAEVDVGVIKPIGKYPRFLEQVLIIASRFFRGECEAHEDVPHIHAQVLRLIVLCSFRPFNDRDLWRPLPVKEGLIPVSFVSQSPFGQRTIIQQILDMQADRALNRF
jgi:hypothetical protein